MKKLIVSLAVLFALSSCTDNTKKTDTTSVKDAKTTTATTPETTVKDGTYSTIKTNKIAWGASHLGGVSPRFGFVKAGKVSFTVADNALKAAEVAMDLGSLTVTSFPEGDDRNDLTKHLKSADFFNVAKYPNATFELTKATKIDGDYNTELTGNLTILDKTNSVTFKANVMISPEAIKLQSEKFAIDRKKWGLTYNTEGTVGVPKDYLIADDVTFQIDFEVAK